MRLVTTAVDSLRLLTLAITINNHAFDVTLTYKHALESRDKPALHPEIVLRI